MRALSLSLSLSLSHLLIQANFSSVSPTRQRRRRREEALSLTHVPMMKLYYSQKRKNVWKGKEVESATEREGEEE